MAYASESQTERVSRGDTTYGNSRLGVSSQSQSGGDRWAFSRDAAGALQGQRKVNGAGAVTERYYYLTDAQGSVVAIIDDSGDLKARYRFDPFGVSRDTGYTNTVDSPWRWQGQYLDGNTGMYKMGERYYAPTMSGDVVGETTLYNRWTQIDPLNQFQDPRQNNRYLYAGQDPVNFADPSGRSYRPVEGGPVEPLSKCQQAVVTAGATVVGTTAGGAATGAIVGGVPTGGIGAVPGGAAGAVGGYVGGLIAAAPIVIFGCS